jgi:hypothetical protein
LKETFLIRSNGLNKRFEERLFEVKKVIFEETLFKKIENIPLENIHSKINLDNMFAQNYLRLNFKSK